MDYVVQCNTTISKMYNNVYFLGPINGSACRSQMIYSPFFPFQIGLLRHRAADDGFLCAVAILQLLLSSGAQDRVPGAHLHTRWRRYCGLIVG